MKFKEFKEYINKCHPDCDDLEVKLFIESDDEFDDEFDDEIGEIGDDYEYDNEDDNSIKIYDNFFMDVKTDLLTLERFFAINNKSEWRD